MGIKLKIDNMLPALTEFRILNGILRTLRMCAAQVIRLENWTASSTYNMEGVLELWTIGRKNWLGSQTLSINIRCGSGSIVFILLGDWI